MSAPPTLVHVDGHARVWIAFEGGTVRRLDPDGRVEEYGPAEGLPHTTVHAITHDRWGDIWIGGNGGLSRLQGSRFRTLSFRNEVRGWPIAAVIEDDSGDLWIAFAFFGFIRAARDDVLRAMSDSSYALHYRVYNTGDGAGYPDVYYGGKTGKGPGGELWFLMSRGVTVFDPQEFRKENPTSGRLRIEGVTADDHRYSRAAATVLPPRTSRLRIDYTVVSLSTLERIRFRYRLDGFDTNWVDGTGPRQALYTNLPPGDYRFRLQASTNAAEWNEAETNWSFSIQPMFYQTRWFYSLCALGLVLCAMGAWQLRVRQVRKELGVVFGERIRLSREIHDTLLQNLVGLALQLDAASHDLREPSSGVRAQLVRMRRQVEDYIREVKQSIWDLRSPALDKHGLIGALRATGERLTAGKVRFALTVTGTPRPCPARVETHVLRIGHEALMNAVRHAEARQVQMEIGFDADRLSLRVVDDGRGFDPEQPIDSDARHYGLMSMKERAVDAGGCCTIESQPGSGVQVVAEFPLAPTA
jgi:signal transduction histidine kinase